MLPYKDPIKAREASSKSALKWYENNKERAAANARAWRRRNPKYMLRKSAERRAKLKGVEFSLSLEDMPDIPDICPIALIPIHFKQEQTRGPCDNSPTLDRINPDLGYIHSNVRVISHRANRWKGEMTRDDLLRVLQYMDNEI